MKQLTNPKVIFKGNKLLLIDAPEMPNANGRCISLCEYKDSSLCECRNKFNEALSKAPTWEIKNGEEARKELWKIPVNSGMSGDPEKHFSESLKGWQPEQGKLYDLPKGYSYILKERCSGREEICGDQCEMCPFDAIKFAILIPQQEVKEEIQEDLWNEEKVQALINQEGVQKSAEKVAYHWFWLGFKAAKGEI